jgi:hypothetical protein
MVNDLFSDFILRDLNGNQLTGEIPSSIGSLVNLEILFVVKQALLVRM